MANYGAYDPVDFARSMREKVAASQLNGQSPSWGAQFGIKSGSPDEWARFFTMVGQQESGHRVAPVRPDGSLERFRSTLPGEKSFGPFQFNKGEYGLNSWSDVNDPNKVQDALIRVALAGKIPAYFGSVQRPKETLQHENWYTTTVKPELDKHFDLEGAAFSGSPEGGAMQGSVNIGPGGAASGMQGVLARRLLEQQQAQAAVGNGNVQAEPIAQYSGMTPDDVDQAGKLAQALMARGSDTSPVQHWTQALARVMDSGVGAMYAEQARKGRAEGNNALVKALQQKADPATLVANPWTRDMGTKLWAQQQAQNTPQAQAQLRLTEANAKKAEREAVAGVSPANVREWQYYNSLSPQDQERYLTMKRADKWVDAGTSFARPNPANPQAPMQRIPKDVAGTEIEKGAGQTIAKARAELPEAKARFDLVSGSLDRLKATADSVSKQKGLDRVVGGLLQAYTPNLTEDALNAQTELENLKVKISGAVLQAMRDASKTGGAVGQVTEREWPRLENMIANLDPRQGKAQFMRNLNEIVKYADDVKRTLADAYKADVRAASGQSIPEGVMPNARPSQAGAPSAVPNGWSIQRLD
jgi:hypothetical protein